MNNLHLAPIEERALTIPRFEMQAAVVAWRMENALPEEITLKVKCVYFWCQICNNNIKPEH